MIVDHHDFTRANVAHQLGADDIQCAGFGGEHVGAVLHLAEGERAEAVRVECADHGVFGHQQVGETAMHRVERFLELVHKGALHRTANQVHQTSVSEFEWKMAPSSSSLRRSDGQFVRLPLWHRATSPSWKRKMNGWMLSVVPEPAVA